MMQTQQPQQHNHQQIVAGSSVILKMNETVVQQLSTVGEYLYIAMQYIYIIYIYICIHIHNRVCARCRSRGIGDSLIVMCVL